MLMFSLKFDVLRPCLVGLLGSTVGAIMQLGFGIG